MPEFKKKNEGAIRETEDKFKVLTNPKYLRKLIGSGTEHSR